MPGRDGTGPLGMGPCGKKRCVCRDRYKENFDDEPVEPGRGRQTGNANERTAGNR